jgi:hypothetical protein
VRTVRKSVSFPTNKSQDQTKTFRLKISGQISAKKPQKLKEWTEGHLPIKRKNIPSNAFPSIHPNRYFDRSAPSSQRKRGKIENPPKKLHSAKNFAFPKNRICMHLRDSNSGRARALVALGSHDHVVEGAEVEAGAGPGVNVGGKVDGAAGAVVGADRPVLLEGRGALDRGLVLARGLQEGVGGAVDVGAADGAGGRGRVVAAEGLDDVELDQGRLGPAVEGEVPVA